jgi:hypothetical protein
MSNWRRPRPKQQRRRTLTRVAFVLIALGLMAQGGRLMYQLFVLNQAPANIPRFGIATFFFGLITIAIGLWKCE